MSKIEFTNDIDSLQWEEIYPNVIVYRNMLRDPEKAYEIMRKSEAEADGRYFLEKWTPWSHFGTYAQKKWGQELDETEKTQEFYEEKSLDDEISAAYNKAVSHYSKHTGIDFPENAYYSGHSYCKYFDDLDNLKNNMTMQYHTDYIISQKDMPGAKFHTTCTFYINDNYGGGDLEFFIDGKLINHKPQAGDLVVFPSTDPYFHGVKKITSGNKFFVRNFVMNDYNGSDEWLANQKRFGAYRWAKTEIERIDKEDKDNMIYFSDGQKITFEEAQRIRAEILGEN